MKILNQLNIGPYSVIQVDGNDQIGKVAIIDGKKYDTEIVYDLPNSIAIKGEGDFVGKEVHFND
jgi:hypothetical protein